jgi:two-component system OmpR family response regulator
MFFGHNLVVRVLLVEDDRKLARLIARVFGTEGMDVDICHDGDEGTDHALRGTYDVLVVDWMLPGRDGPSLCRAVRSSRLPVGILLLTARSQIEDRVTGLDSGADDYLVKPFAFEELLARVRALARRQTAAQGADGWELRRHDLVLDLRGRTARRGETGLNLTPTEWRLVEFFLRHPGQALSRRQIIDYVWSYADPIRPTQVDVFVSNLRSKLRRGGAVDPISTVRGIGYRLD